MFFVAKCALQKQHVSCVINMIKYKMNKHPVLLNDTPLMK